MAAILPNLKQSKNTCTTRKPTKPVHQTSRPNKSQRQPKTPQKPKGHNGQPKYTQRRTGTETVLLTLHGIAIKVL
jgi:hypothetical protein